MPSAGLHMLLAISVVSICLQKGLTQYDETHFIHHTVRDGLSDNYITCLQQDSRGYLWIGTDAGLNRFDGHTFKTFHQGSTTLPLLSNIVRNIKTFGEGRIGVISRGGFQLLDTDDLSCKNYVIPDTTTFSVYLNAAIDVVELQNKSFGISTTTGFYVFDVSGNLTFRHDAYRPEDIDLGRIFYGREIFSLDDRQYLVYVRKDGLASYDADANTFQEITSPQGDWRVLSPPESDHDAGYVIRSQISHDEFIIMNYDSNSIRYYNRSADLVTVNTPGLPKNEFNWESKIAMFNDSIFAVNTALSGFYIFHLNRKSGTITLHPRKFLAGHKIQCLFVDREQRLWVGTANGLLHQKLATPLIKTYHFQPSSTDTLTGGLSCIYRYRDKLYAGRFSINLGLLILDAATKTTIQQVDLYGKNSPWNQIRTIQLYHPDTLWIGTDAGLLWFDTVSRTYGKVFDGKRYSSDLPYLTTTLPAGPDGYAWMCRLMGGVLARYHIPSRTFTFFTADTDISIPFQKVKSIAYDTFGDVWVSGHALARWNTRKQVFDTLITQYAGRNRFEDDILVLVADHTGSLWLHSPHNGLLEYRIPEKTWVTYTMREGLPSDVIIALSPVMQDQLWIACPNHLTNFNIRTGNISVYDGQDGLPEDKFSSRYFYYDSADHQLYLFHHQTLATLSVPPAPRNDRGSALIIEELVINNIRTVFYPPENMHFKPGEKNLSLCLGIVDFEFGSDYQFAFRINSDSVWTNIADQRQINLTGLSPGNYTVRLRATGKSGEPKYAMMRFLIAPPFWQTPWFVVLCVLTVATGIYALHRRRVVQIEAKAGLERQLSQSEMKALHAQMNPHFVFNSLNSIEEMIMNNEINAASHFLGKFAHLIRMTLHQSEQSFISLRTTIDYLARYIEMEQIRNNRFTCSIRSAEELSLDETFLPPMLIQPFIENAIWHGTNGHHQKIEISVDFNKDHTDLVCTIDDNGTGIEASKKQKGKGNHLHRSIGISNIEHRILLLNEIYGLKYNVMVEDKSRIAGNDSTGTRVTLRMPLETDDYE